MRPTRVALRNYRTYKSADMEIKRAVALVFALNGVGKTGLRDGMRLSLTGEVEGLGKGGLTVERLVRRGEAAGGVRVEWERGPKPGMSGAVTTLSVERRISAKGLKTKLNDKDAPNDVADYFVGGTSPASLLSLCSDAESFLSASKVEQKALVLSLLDDKVPEAALAGLPLDRLPAVPRTLADVETACAVAVAGRQAAKRKLERLPEVAAPSTAVPPIEAMEQTLEGLVAHSRRLAGEMGEMAGERRALSDSRGRITTFRGRYEAALADLGPLAAAEARQSKAADALTLARDSAASYDTKAAALTAKDTELAGLTDSHAGIAKIKDVCPVVGQGVKCPLPETEKKTLHTSWDRRIKTLAQEAKAAKAALGKKPDTKAPGQELEAAEAAVKSIVETTALLETAVGEVAKIDARIAEIDGGETAQALTNVDDRIRDGREKVAKAKNLKGDHDAASARLKERQETQAEIDEWDALAQALGPNGVQLRLIAERVGAFEKSVNERTQRFGLTFSISTEPWEVRLGDSHPALESKGRRLIEGLALALAVAESSGLRWVAADGVDVLDGANRGIFFAMLGDAVRAGTIDGALVTATYNDPAALKAKYADWVHPFVAESSADGGTVIRSLLGYAGQKADA